MLFAVSPERCRRDAKAPTAEQTAGETVAVHEKQPAVEAVATKGEPADLGDEASKAQKDQAQEEQHAGEDVAPQKDQAVGKAEAQEDQALGKVASVKKKPARTDSQFGGGRARGPYPRPFPPKSPWPVQGGDTCTPPSPRGVGSPPYHCSRLRVGEVGE